MAGVLLEVRKLVCLGSVPVGSHQALLRGSSFSLDLHVDLHIYTTSTSPAFALPAV